MPYLHLSLGCPLTQEQSSALYQTCARLIAILPEKNVENCMVRIEQDCALYFKGDRRACAFVELRLYTPSPEDKKSAFVSQLTDTLCEELSLTPDLIYMNILELDHWVVGGSIKHPTERRDLK